MEELAKRFADLADKFGPQVADAAMAAVRVNAWSNLIAAVVGEAIGLAIALGIYKIAKLARREDCPDWLDYNFEGVVFVGIVCATASAAFLLINTITLMDLWTYVGFMHPDVWLAHKALKI